jgi:hypothetical protein
MPDKLCNNYLITITTPEQALCCIIFCGAEKIVMLYELV